jgi:2-succinyl-6-hydroxy-2,4-cyclohexadiene-1-carboxylate synthase
MPRERVNSIDIHFEAAPAGLPLLMLHGFTGSTQSWQGTPEKLSASEQDIRPIAVDLIGHGQTSAPDDPDRYQIEHAVADLVELLDRLEIEQTALLGYSMGGRVALHLALTRPERISSLILESASPGIDDPQARDSRRASDVALARMIEDQGLTAFIDHWESIPLFESQQSLPDEVRRRQRALRLAQSATGLANSLRGMGAGAMTPVSARLKTLPMPLLYLAGEFDEKYRATGELLASNVPHGRYVEIPGAGHTVHLEQPESYEDAVLRFLNE